MKKICTLLALSLSVLSLSADWESENLYFPEISESFLFKDNGKRFKEYEQSNIEANSILQGFIEYAQAGEGIYYCYSNMPLSWKVYLKTISPKLADSIGEDIINQVNELLFIWGEICLKHPDFLEEITDEDMCGPLFASKADFINLGETLKSLSKGITYENLKSSNLEAIARSCEFKPNFSKFNYSFSNVYVYDFPENLMHLRYCQDKPVVKSAFVLFGENDNEEIFNELFDVEMVCVEGKWVPLELANNYNSYFIRDTPRFIEELKEHINEERSEINLALNGVIALSKDLLEEEDKAVFDAKFKALEYFLESM